MIRIGSILLALALLAGCGTPPRIARSATSDLFAPVSISLSPVFTRAADWTGDGKPDGIELVVEFQDSFGDTTKAAGRFVFELFAYQANTPGFKGPRLANPFRADLTTAAAQRQYWSKTSRAYTFRLEYPRVSAKERYIVTAMFEPQNGRRLFAELVAGPADDRR